MVAVLLTVAILYVAREIFIPFALALLIAFLLSPLVRRLETLRLPRVLAVALVLCAALLSAGTVGWIVANQLIDVTNQIPAYRDNIHQKLETLSLKHGGSFAQLKNSVEELDKEFTGAPPATPPRGSAPRARPGSGPTPAAPMPVQVVSPPATVIQAARSILGPLIVPLGTSLVVIVFTAFILLNRADLRNRLIRLIAPKELNVMTQAIDEAAERVSKYLRMQLIVNTAFGAIFAAGLFFIGLPNAILWGVLGGLLRFIPYLGPPIGGLLPFVLSLAVFPGWREPLLTFGFFMAVELTTSQLLEPWAYGSRTGISPLAILVSAVFWTTLWGPLGLILATPLTVCVVVLGRYVPQLEFLFVLLGDEPVLSPQAQLYQRLLAMDYHEARAVLVEFIKANGVLALYDTVMLPALAMAEEDRHKGVLDEAREEFITQSINEFILEVPQITAQLEKAGDTETESSEQPQTAALAGRALPGQARNVLCVAASDQADEIAEAMLAQLLEQRGDTVTCLSAAESRSLISDQTKLTEKPMDFILISALPPFALLSARTLAKRLHAQFPQSQLLIGLWSLSSDAKDAEERLGKALSHPLVTTLADALAHIAGETPGVEPEAAEPNRSLQPKLTLAT